MCLTVPARVLRVEGNLAWIDHEGTARPVRLATLDRIQPGDYVLHQAGLAIERVDAAEASAILAILAELTGEDDSGEVDE